MTGRVRGLNVALELRRSSRSWPSPGIYIRQAVGPLEQISLASSHLVTAVPAMAVWPLPWKPGHTKVGAALWTHEEREGSRDHLEP